jgi:hypothetical protein
MAIKAMLFIDVRNAASLSAALQHADLLLQ